MAIMRAPQPGVYTGTVGGHNALISVTSVAVYLKWHVPSDGFLHGYVERQNSFDINNGAFLARGIPEIRINQKSRQTPGSW